LNLILRICIQGTILLKYR